MAPGGLPAGSAASQAMASTTDSAGLSTAYPAGPTSSTAAVASLSTAAEADSAYRTPVRHGGGDPVHSTPLLPWDLDGEAGGGGDHSAVHHPDSDGFLTPGQYTWNLVVGITASAVFVLVTAAALLGLIAFRRYMKRRNRTLSADTGVFSPRRGSKAGLDMIDNAVVLTSHRPLQRTGSIRKQFQKFLTR